MIEKKQFFITLIFCFVSIVLFASIASVTSANPTSSLIAQVQPVLPDDFNWQANPDISGVESVIALGNPNDSQLYVLFSKMATVNIVTLPQQNY